MGTRWSEPGEGEARKLKMLAALLYAVACIGVGLFGLASRYLPNPTRRNPLFDLNGGDAAFFGALLLVAGAIGFAYAVALWRGRY
jgi:hypothetical protein